MLRLQVSNLESARLSVGSIYPISRQLCQSAGVSFPASVRHFNTGSGRRLKITSFQARLL